MHTPLHGSKPPFTLPSNVVYFHDWRYVNHGGLRWMTSEEKSAPLWGSEAVPPMRYEYRDMPLGIRLVAQRAQKTEPALTPEQTGEWFLLSSGNLIYDEGRYRLWYDCLPRADVDTPQAGNFNLIRYAESDNGADWTLPKLGLVEQEGTRENNIVYGGALTREHGYHGGCVFKDPSAPPEERYKVFHLGSISQEELAEYRRVTRTLRQ